MNRCKKLGVWILTLALLLSCQPVFAAGEKYAFVDVAKVFDEYQKTKDNDAVLQQAQDQKEKERQVIVEDIRKMKDEIALLSDDAKKSKQEAIDARVRDLQDFDLQLRQDLGQKRQAIIKEIFTDIDNVVQNYGKAKGYDLVLNSRALLYQNPKLDITTDVLTELNKNAGQKKK